MARTQDQAQDSVDNPEPSRFRTPSPPLPKLRRPYQGSHPSRASLSSPASTAVPSCPIAVRPPAPREIEKRIRGAEFQPRNSGAHILTAAKGACFFRPPTRTPALPLTPPRRAARFPGPYSKFLPLHRYKYRRRNDCQTAPADPALPAQRQRTKQRGAGWGRRSEARGSTMHLRPGARRLGGSGACVRVVPPGLSFTGEYPPRLRRKMSRPA